MSRSAPATQTARKERMTSLHDVVLNYLQTHAYASTARTLVQGRPGGVSGVAGVGGGAAEVDCAAGGDKGDAMEVDEHAVGGDAKNAGIGSGAVGVKGKDVIGGVRLDEEALVAIERRQAIINHILNGAIMRAVDALNTYFPSVLDDSVPIASSSSNGISSNHTNGHSIPTSPTTASNLGRRASASWSNPLGSSGSLWSGQSPSSGATNGYSHNGTSTNGNGYNNGYSNGHGAKDDHALPVMHTSLHPAHVKLNLSIQAFIESFRQLAPSSSPSTPSSSIGSLSGSINMSSSIQMTGPSGMGSPLAHGNSDGLGAVKAKANTNPAGSSSSAVTLTNALTAAQGLHQEAKKLAPEDRAVYLQEIKDVGALLAYTEPETSILKGFLEQTRRIALANQVNRAILNSEGRQPTSKLEQYARRTTALWAIMAEKGIDAQPSWSQADGHGKEQLGAFWKGHQSKTGFKLRDFVAHSYV